MANIAFVHRGGEQMASYRYRCAIPGAELEKAGHTVSFNGGEAHICVFSKPVLDDLTMAKIIKDNGCRVVVDICDDHFNHPELGYVYGHMLQVADFILCPTENMKVRMQEFTEEDITVIGDPYEVAYNQPHAKGDDYLWFGHNANIQDIFPYQDLNPHVVTGPNLPKWKNCTLWSQEAAETALFDANKVLLPTRSGVGYKSPNRLINALRAGCFPICDPHPAYEEFRDFVWTGGVTTGVRWAKEFEADLNDRVAEGQQYIETHYSPEAIGKKWISFIDSI